MSSRVQQKAAARRHRQAFEAAEQQATERRRAVRRLAVVVAAALVVVAGAVAVTRLGGDDPPAAAAQPAAVSARFAGLPQDGITLGSPRAAATLVEFADLQCPYCGVYGREVLPAVIERYVRPGRVKLELNLLTFLGEDSVQAGRAAAAAALQDRFWNFADSFYAAQGLENTGYVTEAFLDRAGTAAGIDLATASQDQNAPAAAKLLRDAHSRAERLQVQSTPSFFVRVGSGELRPLAITELTPAAFVAALEKALAR